MDRKRKQRSVATQKTGFHEISDDEALPQTGKLCKKAGFRDLVQKSVTVVAQENDETADYPPASRERASKSTQAQCDFQNPRLKSGASLEFSIPRRKDDESRRTTSEMVRLVEGRTGYSNPGTSGMTPAGYSSYSMTSQMNEMYLRPHEGSLAVVYSYGDKTLPNSISSNLGFHFGSQGSRRFSDETVLLIEDYQSYDFINAARRQEMDLPRRGSVVACCNRSKRSSRELLTRPLQLEFGDIDESDESAVCRICHEGEEVEPLIQPCLCKGSVGCVHAKCLKVWLEQSNTSRCELCNYPYAIRQSKKYSKCVSVRVFFKTVVDRRSMAYDVVSFVVITPLTLVGVVMCIQASIHSGESGSDSSYKMGNITRVGMLMLSGTIVVAYGVWLYTLISFYFKSWRKWYENCYDVEVLPVRMTSEERLEAARRLSEEMGRRQLSREHGSALIAVLHSPTTYSYQRRVSVPPMTPVPAQADR